MSCLEKPFGLQIDVFVCVCVRDQFALVGLFDTIEVQTG